MWVLSRTPVMWVPVGFVGGLPVGMQLVGKPFAEGTLLAAAHAYQQATDWHLRRRRPSRPPPSGATDVGKRDHSAGRRAPPAPGLAGDSKGALRPQLGDHVARVAAHVAQHLLGVLAAEWSAARADWARRSASAARRPGAPVPAAGARARPRHLWRRPDGPRALRPTSYTGPCGTPASESTSSQSLVVRVHEVVAQRPAAAPRGCGRARRSRRSAGRRGGPRAPVRRTAAPRTSAWRRRP